VTAWTIYIELALASLKVLNTVVLTLVFLPPIVAVNFFVGDQFIRKGGMEGSGEVSMTQRLIDHPHQANKLKYSPGTPHQRVSHFEGTKKDYVVTFIQQVDEIASLACWSDREWVLNLADLVIGCLAPLGRWIWTGLSVGQPITQEQVVQDLMEAYGDSQTCFAVYKKLEQCKQWPKEWVVEFKVRALLDAWKSPVSWPNCQV